MNYPGSKGGDGVWQKIINHFPPHKSYYELFLGTGEIIRRKLPAQIANVGIEMNLETIKKVSWRKYKHIEVRKGDAFELLRATETFNPNTLIYLDPPYPLNSRKSQRPIYKFELTDEEHQELLELIISLPCMVAISTYPNEIYKKALKKWNRIEFQTGTRGGPATEVLYMNYEKPKKLHDYRFLGEDRTDRQRIRRKIQRHIDKLLTLEDPRETMAICEAVHQAIITGKRR